MTRPLPFPKWKKAVDRASLQLWGITPEDGGWSEADLRHHFRPDLMPEEFVRWYGEKYDLRRVDNISPFAGAKALTPWWMEKIRDFDGLEIQPCAVIDTACGKVEEPCDPEDAHCWTVYGHYRPGGEMGGVDALQDFPTEAEAQEFHDQLVAAYPHLAGEKGGAN
jgi:hypothetical protein